MLKRSATTFIMHTRFPEYLSKAKNVEFWDIQDPKGMDDNGYERIISQIKAKVKIFLKENKVVCKV